MASLLDAYQAICNWEIPVTTGTDRTIKILAFQPGEVRSKVDAGTVPRRLLFPPGVYGEGVSSFKPVAFKATEVTWVMTDLMLYQAVGLNEQIGPLYLTEVSYCDAYMGQVSRNRTPAAGFTIVNINFRTGIFNYPHRSNNEYNGVAVDLYLKTNVC